MKNSIEEDLMKKKIFACIFARGGSKGVKRKNVKILGDKPLISYSIDSALSNEYIDNVFVSKVRFILCNTVFVSFSVVKLCDKFSILRTVSILCPPENCCRVNREYLTNTN